jgi:type I restriction enzyme S subunit
MHVPDGWRQEKLGKISTAVTSGSRDWAQFYSDSGSKFIRMTNLRRDGIYLKLDDLKYVDVKSESADGKRTALANGDILISITAELGKIGWIPENFGEAFINQHTALVRINQNKADSKFIAYLLSSKKMNAVINQLNDAGAKAGLNLPTIKALPLLLPPFKEQQKISRILSTWDKAIEKLEALITAKQKRKKALMQQLLTGKKRFAGFEEEWELKRLDSLAKVFIGLVTTMTTNYVDCGVPLIRNSDIKQNKITKEKLIYLSQDFASANKERKLKTGDIVTVHTGEVGVSSVIDKELNGSIGFATLNTRLKSDEISPEYLCWYFNSEHFIQWCVAMSTGDGRQNLNLKDFVKSKIIFPGNIEEQQKIASVLSAANTEIQTHQKQLAALKQQKKCLMQQLLTGKKRVKVDSHV